MNRQNSTITIAVTLTLLLLMSCSAIVCAADHAVVLQYHHVSEQTPASTSISPALFERHLDYLESNRYTVWPLEKIVQYLREGQSLPDKCVALTFDDAYLSVYTHAWPLLRKKNQPFTVFIATEGVDKGHGAFMTWEQMRKMGRAGAAYAGHSHTHPHMVRLKPGESMQVWENRMRTEILTANRRLTEELGSESILFAYPYGEYNLALKRLVTGLGLVGIGQHSGAVWKWGDFGALPRFPMSGPYAKMSSLKEKIDSLPLPVIAEDPEDPQLTAENARPALRLTLAPGDYSLDSIACYASGQGRMPIRWIDRKKPVFECRSERPLPLGRSRYNCTAPHINGERYFWFSRQWIR